MKIAVVGTGYVGLVSGVCFAELGHDVTCIDKDPNKLALLDAGKSPIYEPGLEEVMERTLSSGRLKFTGDLATAVAQADVVFIAVGTPTRRGEGSADLTYVYTATTEIAQSIQGYTVVVTKSTVPVGTNEKVKALISKANPEASFDVASNPEFLREGAALKDFLEPDRIVVGVDTPEAGDVLAEVYQPLTDQGYKLVTTDLASAEMAKYAANAFLATKITFVNEIAALCERVGADVRAVSHAMGLDARVGARFLEAGPGYGGSCFPKDTKALARTAQENGVPMHVLSATILANDEIKRRMIEKIEDLCPNGLRGSRIAVLGVTFKANTDDMRDAPALTIVPALIGLGAEVHICDPQGQREGEALLPGTIWQEDPYAAARDADLVVVLTEWEEFRTLDLNRLAGSMHQAHIADLRNLYTPDALEAAGFTAHAGLGRAASIPATLTSHETEVRQAAAS